MDKDEVAQGAGVPVVQPGLVALDQVALATIRKIAEGKGDAIQFVARVVAGVHFVFHHLVFDGESAPPMPGRDRQVFDEAEFELTFGAELVVVALLAFDPELGDGGEESVADSVLSGTGFALWVAFSGPERGRRWRGWWRVSSRKRGS